MITLNTVVWVWSECEFLVPKAIIIIIIIIIIISLVYTYQ